VSTATAVFWVLRHMGSQRAPKGPRFIQYISLTLSTFCHHRVGYPRGRPHQSDVRMEMDCN